jgi:uncharacterized membrane protein YphA (DoxX/SURF4 family)
MLGWQAISRFIIGGVFLYAGLYKAFKPAEAVLALRSLEVTHVVAESLVFFVTVVEIHIGILLVMGINVRAASAIAVGFLLVFTVFLSYLATLAAPPGCGCPDLIGLFDSNRHKALFGIFRNVALLAILAALARKMATETIAQETSTV